MKKVNISICSSRNCYVEGAKLFKQLDTMMSARLKAGTERTGTGCHGYCIDCGTNAPCAVINNRPIFKATPALILKAIKTA